MKHKRSKATDIPYPVKQRVWERDNNCCILCGKNYTAMPNAHFIPRSKGGLGIEQNIVTLCAYCHHKYDFGDSEERNEMRHFIRNYLQNKYDDWNLENLIYHKE